jgi:GT2 family glycosyltransferase
VTAWRRRWNAATERQARARLRRWTTSWAPPRLSILIPSRDHWSDLLLPCLLSLERTTRSAPIEVIVGDSGSGDATRTAYCDIGLPWLAVDGPFNFARVCNALAAEARGEHLLFLNNDTTALTGDWLPRVLASPPLGVLGALLVFPASRRLQHAGVEVVSLNTARETPHGFPVAASDRADVPILVQHIGVGTPLDEVASLDRSRLMAVTGAWLSTPRACFRALGGFDERYETDLQDADYCLRLRATGLPVTCATDIVFTHAQSATRGAYAWPRADWTLFLSRWKAQLEACA